MPGVKYLAVKLTQLMSWLGKGTGLAAAAPVLYSTVLMLSDAFAKTYAAGKVDIPKLATLLLVTLPDTLCYMTSSSSMLCKVSKTLGRAGAATQLVRTVIGILQDAWWVFNAMQSGDLTASVSSFSGCFSGVQAKAVAAKSAKIEAKNAAYRAQKAETAKARTEYSKTHTLAPHWGRAAADAADDPAALIRKRKADAHNPKIIEAEKDVHNYLSMLDVVYGKYTGKEFNDLQRKNLMNDLQPYKKNPMSGDFLQYFDDKETEIAAAAEARAAEASAAKARAAEARAAEASAAEARRA